MTQKFDIENIEDILKESIGNFTENPEEAYQKISGTVCARLEDCICREEDKEKLVVGPFESNSKFETGVLTMDRKELNRIVGEVVQSCKNLNVI